MPPARRRRNPVAMDHPARRHEQIQAETQPRSARSCPARIIRPRHPLPDSQLPVPR